MSLFFFFLIVALKFKKKGKYITKGGQILKLHMVLYAVICMFFS